MRKIKAFFSQIKLQTKRLLDIIGQFLLKIWQIIKNAYDRYVQPVLGKIGYFLLHNPVINRVDNQLILFSFLKIKVTTRRRQAFYGFLFIGLWLLGYMFFTFYPVINSFWLTFNTAYFHIDHGVQTTWVGFSNYAQVLRDQNVLPLYVSYLGRMLLSVPLIVVFSILIAILVNQPLKGKGIWRTIFFLPVVISTGPVIGELSAQGATSLASIEDNGALQFIIENLGTWIANPIEALMNSLLLILWYAGIPILIFLASLQKIDQSIYEAASIDGASPWDSFWKITLPALKPFISVTIIYVVVSMSLFVETGGILDQARQHMLLGAPDNNLYNGFGYSATIAWIYFILMVLLMLIFVGILSIRRRAK